LHAVGPALLAAFANSPRYAGLDTGWASSRMRSWLQMRPSWTGPVHLGADDADPGREWADYALTAPVVCIRRAGPSWRAPTGMTFADWVSGGWPRRPTVDDLDYHLSTLFPPVRPRGYAEVRYLDAQPPGEWIAPVAALAALFSDESIVDKVRDVCAPVVGRWVEAAREGLADATIARAAGDVLDLAGRMLDQTDLPLPVRENVVEIFDRKWRGRG
jgi:glutamate--cysteine ligase